MNVNTTSNRTPEHWEAPLHTHTQTHQTLQMACSAVGRIQTDNLPHGSVTLTDRWTWEVPFRVRGQHLGS